MDKPTLAELSFLKIAIARLKMEQSDSKRKGIKTLIDLDDVQRIVNKVADYEEGDDWININNDGLDIFAYSEVIGCVRRKTGTEWCQSIYITKCFIDGYLNDPEFEAKWQPLPSPPKDS